MKNSIIVRQAVSKDASGIKALIDKFSFGKGDHGSLIQVSAQDIAHLIGDGNFYVADSSGKIVGCSSIVEYTAKGYGNIAELRSLVVAPEHRRKGVGSDLVHECIKLAKSKGYNILYALTKPENLDFFGKHGFQRSYMPLEKLAKDCHGCPHYNNGCEEIAMVAQLE